MIQGSCLCGSVLFEIDPSGVALTVACYCGNCRKVSGGSYGVYLQVRPNAFRWLAGDREVGSYESSPGNRRGFCRECGCVAPIETAYGPVRVPGGALDADPGLSPEVILFESAKAPWCELDKVEKAFADSGPPEFWASAFR
jgi:hypothetical protein